MNKQDQTPPTFSIEKLYITDISLESPNALKAFSIQVQPQVDVTFLSQPQKVNDDLHEVSLKTTIHAKTESTTIFMLEVTQAGLFRTVNIPEKELGPIVNIGCPNILFPYLREVVSDLAVRAGFPPFLLQPIDFEALYLQQLAENEKKTVH